MSELDLTGKVNPIVDPAQVRLIHSIAANRVLKK